MASTMSTSAYLAELANRSCLPLTRLCFGDKLVNKSYIYMTSGGLTLSTFLGEIVAAYLFIPSESHQ